MAKDLKSKIKAKVAAKKAAEEAQIAKEQREFKAKPWYQRAGQTAKETLFGKEGKFEQKSPHTPEQQAAREELLYPSLEGILSGLKQQQHEYNQPLLNQFLGNQYGPMAQQMALPAIMSLLQTQQNRYPTYGGESAIGAGGDLAGMLGGLLAQGAGSWLGDYLNPTQPENADQGYSFREHNNPMMNVLQMLQSPDQQNLGSMQGLPFYNQQAPQMPPSNIIQSKYNFR